MVAITLNKADGFVGLVAANNIEGQPGVVVVTAKPGSLAEQHGLVPGTVILRVNSQNCETHQSAVSLIDKAKGLVVFEIGDDANIDRLNASLTRGWVFKKSPMGHWQARWLAFDVNSAEAELRYFRSPDDNKPRGTIGAESIVGVRKGTVVSPDEAWDMVIPDGPAVWRHSDTRVGFEVEVSGRVYTFAAANASSATDWVAALTKLRFTDGTRRGQPGAATPAGSTQRDSGAALVAVAPPPSYKPATRRQGGYRDAIEAHMRVSQATPAAA